MRSNAPCSRGKSVFRHARSQGRRPGEMENPPLGKTQWRLRRSACSLLRATCSVRSAARRPGLGPMRGRGMSYARCARGTRGTRGTLRTRNTRTRRCQRALPWLLGEFVWVSCNRLVHIEANRRRWAVCISRLIVCCTRYTARHCCARMSLRLSQPGRVQWYRVRPTGGGEAGGHCHGRTRPWESTYRAVDTTRHHQP